MLNIAIWGKFFVLIQTHRDIRYDEVYAQIMYEQEDKSKEQKARHLRGFQRKSCIMNVVVAVLAATLGIVYVYYAVALGLDIFNPSPRESAIDFYADYNATRKMQWILSAIFSGAIIVLSVALMIKLKVRFDDFYAEYGCFLWAVFSVQALSMIIQTTVEVLRIYDEAVIELPTKIKVVPYSILTVVVNIVTTIVPMLTQLSCLIFGWIRHRRPAAQPQAPEADREQAFGHIKYVKDVVRPDYISYYDPTVEYYIVDVMQYLPERR